MKSDTNLIRREVVDIHYQGEIVECSSRAAALAYLIERVGCPERVAGHAVQRGFADTGNGDRIECKRRRIWATRDECLVSPVAGRDAILAAMQRQRMSVNQVALAVAERGAADRATVYRYLSGNTDTTVTVYSAIHAVVFGVAE